MGKKKCIIDTDLLGDDALAILLATKIHEVVLISAVSGRKPAKETAEDVTRILKLAEREDIPVAIGADKPLNFREKISGCLYCDPAIKNLPKGKNPILTRHAALEIIEIINNSTEKLNLIALGPLTNIAIAILADPGITYRIDQLIIMGGNAMVHGNVVPQAEYNIYADPEAAQIVFRSGLPIVMVGLDVTTKVLLDISHLKDVKPSLIKNFVLDVLSRCIPYQHEVRKLPAFPMHDPLTVGVLFDPSFVKMKRFNVEVEVIGEFTRGATVVDFTGISQREPNAYVCLDVDSERFIKFFIENIFE